MDLFDYPVHAGWKATDTSREAAETTNAAGIRARVLRAVSEGACTADECAARLGMSILTVRPRFSELKTLGKVRDTGERRPNNSGKRAIVWSL